MVNYSCIHALYMGNVYWHSSPSYSSYYYGKVIIIKTIETLYNLLQVNRKIENHYIRYMYLKDVWGLEQSVIGQLEGVSQSMISKDLITARKKVSRETYEKYTTNLWTHDEIHYIHMLPREILPDIVAIAFINNILGVYPSHGFFDYIDTNVNSRIAALAWLGVMNKRLMAIFHKQQPTISMVVKRSKDKVIRIQRPNRYDKGGYKLVDNTKSKPKLTLAGGQN